MITENLDIEYKIFFTLFSKKRQVAMRTLMERGVQSEHFGALFHREIFKEIHALYKKNKMVSLSVFKDHFLNRPSSQSDDELKFSQFMKKVPKAKMAMGDLRHAADMIIEMYVTRKTLAKMNESVDNPQKLAILDIIQELENHHRKMKVILDPENVKAVMGLKSGLEDRIQRAKVVYENPDENGMVVIGLKNLDDSIGRLSPGQLFVYQARTGIGKSMMLMGTSMANFKRGLKVIVITIEMSNTDYLYRFDSNITGIVHKKFRSGEVSQDQDEVNHWRKRVKRTGKDGNDIYVYWVPSNCTPAVVEDIVASNEYKPDLVIVDYAGDMKARIKGVPEYSATAQGEVFSALKEIAGKYNCVVGTAQQSKRGTGGKADTESGAWSDIASAKSDLMMAVQITKEDEDFITETEEGSVVVGRMTVSIIKGRNGPNCKTHIVPRFHKMTWIEKESEDMIPTTGGKDFKTPKRKKQDRLESANDELTEAIEAGNVQDIDLLAGEE